MNKLFKESKAEDQGRGYSVQQLWNLWNDVDDDDGDINEASRRTMLYWKGSIVLLHIAVDHKTRFLNRLKSLLGLSHLSFE